MKLNFTTKKILITLAIFLCVSVLGVVLYAVMISKTTDTSNISNYSLTGEETLFSNYTKISNGKYFILENSINKAIINQNKELLEDYTTDELQMIKYFNSNNYSDYYYKLGENIQIKKDGEIVFELLYNVLDFDVRKSSSKIEALDDNNIFISNDTTIVIEENGKNVTKKISYGYVYNIENKVLYSKIESYDGFQKLYGINDENIILLKDIDGKYNIYSSKNNKVLLDKNYAKIGRLNQNKYYGKSSMYMYVCNNLVDGIYSGCGIIDSENKIKIALNYDDFTITDYNSSYYVIKNNTKSTLYDYSNKVILSDHDEILLSEKFIIAFKNEYMNIYNYELKLIKTIDVKLQEIISLSTSTNHKNIELVDSDETIIINTYDNGSLDEGKQEDAEKIKSYIYSEKINATISSSRIYPVYNDLNEISMYYGLSYSGKSISKVYLYNNKLEAYRIIELDPNNGNFEIIHTCSDLSIGYLLDNNYYIFTLESGNKGTIYSNESEYYNKVCNDIKNNSKDTIKLYNGEKSVVYNQLKEFYKIDTNKYLVFYDNKVGIYTLIENEEK